MLENPIFRTDTVKSGSEYKESFKSLLCSAEWKTYDEARKAGVSANIPIFDMAIPIDANWDSAKKEAWQKKSCSTEERSKGYEAALYTASYAVDPITATAWSQCVSSCTPAALICTLEETQSSVVFGAKWRRSPGEMDRAAPVIRTFTFNNTRCSNTKDLAAKETLGDGNIEVLCSQNLQNAPTFLLVTSRGSCTKATDLTSQEVPLTGKIVLDKPTTYKAPRLALKNDLKLVTNGFPLTIVTGMLVIEGAPQIVSFEERPMQLGQTGRSAAEIRIQADRLQGMGLTIQNFGEDGAKGSTGIQPTGRPARAGKGSPRYYNVGGCQGGTNGVPGVTGAMGVQGSEGAQGGAAGEVVLSIKRGLDSGPGSAISVLTRRADRSGAILDCGAMVCGGLGGPGGDGSPGQLGGQGGEGADGTSGIFWSCNGTQPGPDGNAGPPGLTGPIGRLGEKALIKRF